MEKVQALLRPVWIEKCGIPWGSILILDTKPCQERIQNIDYFILIMCVSYIKLNSITKPF